MLYVVYIKIKLKMIITHYILIISRLCFFCSIFFYTTITMANNNIVPFKLHLTYQDLQEKIQTIDKLCRFLSPSHKIKIIEKICSLDTETQNTSNILEPFCTFKDDTQKINTIKRVCSFHTPRSKAKILEKFCQFKTDRQKQQYIDYLQNIAKVGEALQRIINFNVEAERLNKRKDVFNPLVYHVRLEPHTEAAYQMGVIYGFSDCGFQNNLKAIEFFQKAYDKPETFFMVAELYRIQNNKNMQRRIYDLYNNAIKSGIYTAYYNLAVYMYEQLEINHNDTSLPTDFTYENVMRYLQKATERNNPEAYNDLAILMDKIFKGKNPEKLNLLVDSYLAQSAKNNFMPALYNQILLTLKKSCNIENKKLIEKNIIYLQQVNYQPLIGLYPLIKNNPCYKDI